MRNGGIDVWMLWAMTLLETKKSCPGNIKAYLTSLGKFCEFIVNQTKHNVSGFSTIEQSQLQAITNVISRFRAMLSSISLRSGRSSMRTGKLPWVLSWLRKSWTQEPAKDSIKNSFVSTATMAFPKTKILLQKIAEG